MGKGDFRRPTLIDDATHTVNWCASVGHRMSPLGEWCVNCGKTALELATGADDRDVSEHSLRTQDSCHEREAASLPVSHADSQRAAGQPGS